VKAYEAASPFFYLIGVEEWDEDQVQELERWLIRVKAVS
jgi:hypothetical protein